MNNLSRNLDLVWMNRCSMNGAQDWVKDELYSELMSETFTYYLIIFIILIDMLQAKLFFRTNCFMEEKKKML